MRPVRRPRRSAPVRALSSRALGFTLIELAVVLALIALVTGVAVVKLRGPYRKLRLTASIQELHQLDQMVRACARRSRRSGTLVVDLDRRRVRAYDRMDRERPVASVALGSMAEMELVLPNGQVSRTGEVALPVGTRGQMPTYALKLRAASDPIWIVFAARTGQMISVENDVEVEQLLVSR